MKVNGLSDVIYTNKNLPAGKMKDYFIHVGKLITDSIIQEDEITSSIMKGSSKIASFISMLILSMSCYVFEK